MLIRFLLETLKGGGSSISRNKIQSISNLEVEVSKYRFSINENGTRNIDRESVQEETLFFGIDKEAIEYIIFRDGPPILNIGGYRTYFTYKDNTLSGIYMEEVRDNGSRYLYIVKNYKEILNRCKEDYVIFCNLEKIQESYRYRGEIEMSPDDYLDEFEV